MINVEVILNLITVIKTWMQLAMSHIIANQQHLEQMYMFIFKDEGWYLFAFSAKCHVFVTFWHPALTIEMNVVVCMIATTNISIHIRCIIYYCIQYLQRTKHQLLMLPTCQSGVQHFEKQLVSDSNYVFTASGHFFEWTNQIWCHTSPFTGIGWRLADVFFIL